MKSLSASDIKFIKSLSQKKFRDETGLFIVEGEKLVSEALNSSCSVHSVYYRDEIGDDAMSRITQLSNPSPALAVLHQINRGKCNIKKGLYLALDTIRDPGNLGTIIRIADWFGVNAILATRDTVELYNPKVVQATMGAIFRVPVHYCDLKDTLVSVRDGGGKVYGTFLDGEDIYSKDGLGCGDGTVVIVIGNESNGISDSIAGIVTDRLTIPTFPNGSKTSESLNAAVATAIVTAEIRRLDRLNNK